MSWWGLAPLENYILPKLVKHLALFLGSTPLLFSLVILSFPRISFKTSLHYILSQRQFSLESFSVQLYHQGALANPIISIKQEWRIELRIFLCQLKILWQEMSFIFWLWSHFSQKYSLPIFQMPYFLLLRVLTQQLFLQHSSYYISWVKNCQFFSGQWKWVHYYRLAFLLKMKRTVVRFSYLFIMVWL